MDKQLFMSFSDGKNRDSVLEKMIRGLSRNLDQKATPCE